MWLHVTPTAMASAASQTRLLQTAVLGSLVVGGYWLLRGRYRAGAGGEPFARAPGTRHLVPMDARVDEERVRAFLEREEARSASGGGGGGGAQGGGGGAPR